MDGASSRHLALVAEEASVLRRVQDLLAGVQDPAYELAHVETAESLWVHLDAHPIDLVLLEAGHPEAAVIVGQLGTALPVVFVAERSEASLGPQVKALGAQDYLALSATDPVRLAVTLRAALVRQSEAERWAARLQRARDEQRHLAERAGHDLLQPLRTSSLFLELLQDKWGERLDDDAQHWLAAARDGLRRMQHLIDALQTFVRIDAAPPQCESLDLNALLADTLVQLGERIAATDAAVTHETLPTVMADAAQMQQVLYHLIRNALTFHGEVPPHIHLSAHRTDDGWEVAVRDEGLGLDPAYHERIFGLFERLHSQETYPGVGAGLALCRKIIDRHGGRLWVESEPGHGAAFFFTLPA